MTYENARREQNLLRKRTPSATPAVAEYPEREEHISLFNVSVYNAGVARTD